MGAKYVFNPLTGNLDTTDVVAFNGEVNLGTAAAPSVFFTGDTNTGIYSPGPDQVAISTNGTQRLLIEADGDINIDSGGVFYDATNNRLAIGTTSPNKTLTVTGDVLANALASNGNLEFNCDDNANNGGNDAIIFKERGNEKMRMDGSGMLLVGTASWVGTSSPTTGLQFADNYTVAGPFSGGISSNGVRTTSGATATSTTVSLPNGKDYQNFIGTLYVALTLFNSGVSYIAEYRVKIINGATASFTLVDSNDDSGGYAASIANSYDRPTRVITVSASWTGSVSSSLSATLIGAGAGGL